MSNNSDTPSQEAVEAAQAILLDAGYKVPDGAGPASLAAVRDIAAGLDTFAARARAEALRGAANIAGSWYLDACGDLAGERTMREEILSICAPSATPTPGPEPWAMLEEARDWLESAIVCVRGLLALIRGESPSLLDDTRGGSGHMGSAADEVLGGGYPALARIDAALAARKGRV